MVQESLDQIRNFVIIAHIDHGKSTLADRFLELTGTIPARQFREQFLDQMDIERERGITIKMQPVRMIWRPNHAEIRNTKSEAPNNFEIRNSKFEFSSPEFILNLIDTPGHVDFSYEVSRSLAAVEGAILLVDGMQGIQAQTLSHLQVAKSEGLKIIGAVNKIDLPIENKEALIKEIAARIDVQPEEIFQVSGKTGENVKALLEEVIRKVPAPKNDPSAPFRALIFDSHYDAYRGVIAYIRIFDGEIRTGEIIKCLASGYAGEVLEVGVFRPQLSKQDKLTAGEIGYIATGTKEPGAVRVGDTITKLENKYAEVKMQPLEGYKEPIPMVFAGFYGEDSSDLPALRDALARLKLNDASLSFEPDRQELLGQGFRVGFLGTLHLEITKERLSREYGVNPIITAPSVRYKILNKKDEVVDVYNPQSLPSPDQFKEIREPWIKLEIISTTEYLNQIIKLIKNHRGIVGEIETMASERVLIWSEVPLAEIVTGFYDKLKGISRGYASMSYELLDWRAGDLGRLDILIDTKAEPGLSRIVPEANAERIGRQIVEKLKDILPRQLFPVPLQAAVGSRILARETLPALKKDVTGHLYGGDRTRKMKLWKKQQEGKKRLAEVSTVRIPRQAFFEVFKIGSEE